jgi:hypothetical protein
MSEWLGFDTVIKPVEWGRARYTIISIPDEVAAALRDRGATRVEAEIEGHCADLGISRAAAIGGDFLWAGQSLLRRLGLRSGDAIRVRLRPADPEVVQTPGDLRAAIGAADAGDRWESLTPGKRRGLIYQVESAKSAATRQRRIAALVDQLTDP